MAESSRQKEQENRRNAPRTFWCCALWLWGASHTMNEGFHPSWHAAVDRSEAFLTKIECCISLTIRSKTTEVVHVEEKWRQTKIPWKVLWTQEPVVSRWLIIRLTSVNAASSRNPPLYAKCSGPKRTATNVGWLHTSLSKHLATTEVRATDVSSLHTSLSKHLAATEVRATGRKSFIALTSVSFGTGMIVLVFHDRGTACRFISNWKSCYKVPPPPPKKKRPIRPWSFVRINMKETRRHFRLT